MFQRFHKMREREGGFTLIELLVVILIIAILAAIAIPVFLKQREKGWTSQMESAAKNAATAEESWSTANNGLYTGSLPSLTDEGYRAAADVTTAPTVNTAATKYCVQVSHARLSFTYGISSDSTTPKKGTCSAGVFTAST